MARKRAAAGDAEQGFVQKLAQSLLASSPGTDPQDPAVGRAFSIAVNGLPDGPQKKTLQGHAKHYAAALQDALVAAAKAGTAPSKPAKKHRKAPAAELSVSVSAERRSEGTAASAPEPAVQNALVDDTVYLQHVQHAAIRDRNQHVTRHAVEEATHGGEAAALLQARAPPLAALLRLYGASHDQLLGAGYGASFDAAVQAAGRCLALGAALSRQCGPAENPNAGLTAAIAPLTAAVRILAEQQQQSAGASAEALQRVAALAARMLAVLSLRRRGSGMAANAAGAAWLAAPEAGSSAAQDGAVVADDTEVPAAELEPAVAVIQLRSELRLLQTAVTAPDAGDGSGPAGPVAPSRGWLLEHGRPEGPAVSRAAADMRLLLGSTALPVIQQLLLPPQLPAAGEHGEAVATTLWRVLFHASLQSGSTQEDYLARLCAVQRAKAELPAAAAEHEAAQAAAQARRMSPPPVLLSWLKSQPPSAVQTGLLAAAAGGHPEAVTTFLLDSVPLDKMQAMLRSWLTAKAGLQNIAAAAGNTADDHTASGATMDDDLLFYVSTEGDAAAAGAARVDGDEGEDSGSDDGLDLAELPGSDGDAADSDASDDQGFDSDELS